MEISSKAGMGIIAAIVVIVVLGGIVMMKRSDPKTQMSSEAKKNFEMYQKSGSAGMPNRAPSGDTGRPASPMQSQGR